VTVHILGKVRTDSDQRFDIPLSLIVQREQEMRNAAQAAGIDKSVWNGSLLIKMLEEHHTEMKILSLKNYLASWGLSSDGRRTISAGTFSENDYSGSTSNVVIELSPDSDTTGLARPNQLLWSSALTDCIRLYYNPTKVCVTDDTQGNDVLLALDYFQVIYGPDQLTFTSFGCYLRVKLWCDYYSHRVILGNWIVKRLLAAHSRHSHAFVTSPDPVVGASVYVGNKRCEILDGGLVIDPAVHGSDCNSYTGE